MRKITSLIILKATQEIYITVIQYSRDGQYSMLIDRAFESPIITGKFGLIMI